MISTAVPQSKSVPSEIQPRLSRRGKVSRQAGHGPIWPTECFLYSTLQNFFFTDLYSLPFFYFSNQEIPHKECYVCGITLRLKTVWQEMELRVTSKKRWTYSPEAERVPRWPAAIRIPLAIRRSILNFASTGFQWSDFLFIGILSCSCLQGWLLRWWVEFND